jgi:phenylacetate-CoA ligase
MAVAANQGDDYLGRYAVWTSSGTSGRPGVFIQSRDALTVYDGLLAVRCKPGGGA